MPPGFYDFAARFLGNRLRLVGDKAHKFAELMNADSDDDMYRRLISYWQNSIAMVKGACPEETTLVRATRQFSRLSFTERMMATETLTYLPDDIMVKVDRASMGVSLESRAPFLHHELVELAWSLPSDCKIRNGKGKWLLRQVLDRYVPRELIDRPKMGFAVPIDSWLRGPLREWAEPLFLASRPPARLGRAPAGAQASRRGRLLRGRADQKALERAPERAAELAVSALVRPDVPELAGREPTGGLADALEVLIEQVVRVTMQQLRHLNELNELERTLA
jgi:asparagine synthetase B (glutamine-hydrolysing)